MPTKVEKRKGRAVRPRERASSPRRRLPPAERRIQILQAAKDLFATGGVEQVSMRNIAMRVGITQAAIYQHFDDKEAILFAVCEDFFARLIEANEKVMAEKDPIERLKKCMRTYVGTGLALPEEYRLVFMTSISGLERRGGHRVPPGLEHEISPSKGKVAFGYLHDQVRELIAAGLIRGKDVDVTAEAIWAAGHGIVSLLITHQNFPWNRDKLIDTQLNMMLLGLLPDGSPARAEALAQSGCPFS